MYNPKEIEKEIEKFWEENKIYEKVKNRKGKEIYFLDGPPYTTGSIHLGTAWNKILKDFYIRVCRMKGFNVWDRAGWDMHGLPITHKVMKKFNLEKHDIEKFGVERFIKECEKFALTSMKTMEKQFKKLGVWMDWENAYMPIKPEFIEANWWLVKKAHENGFLYEGKKTMHWCPKCATSLAKHELDYKEIEDESIFVKFPVEGRKDEFLLIWTTTPWTLPYNLAVMVNPDVEYVKAEVDVSGKKEKWIIAKALSTAVLAGVFGKKFKILEEFKGEKLKGLSYKHPFFEEISFHSELKKKNKKAYTVVLSSEYVNTSSGTGLVHCAPGCGPEDYEVGHREKLPPYNTLNEKGVLEDIGEFSGLKAKIDDKKFIEALKKKGLLLEVTKVKHDYAHCWRCKTAVVYRTTTQWFFDVESKLKKLMINTNKKVKWQPDWAGNRWMHSWLENLRDNGITRQIYWGIPVPIWKCKQCKNVEVIGSIKELEEKSGKKAPSDLHRPYIDRIILKCSCGSIMKRIPDVLDVWVDSGSTSFTCLDFPQRKDLFEKYWPADLIIEGKDQIRGWFNLLLVVSMVAFQKHPYKAVYMHGFINDVLGRKMSKSLGNIISPDEVVNKYGVDATRLYMLSATPPGIDLNYDTRETGIKLRSLFVFYNIAKYILDYSKILGKPDFKVKKSELDVEERYILSRLNSTIKDIDKLFEELQFNKIPTLIEKLFLDLSRFYIQVTREKISTGSVSERKKVLNTIAKVYYECLLLLAPVCPFLTEKIYQSLKKEFSNVEEFAEKSIHLTSWPKADNSLISKDLEESVEIVKDIIEVALSEREEAKVGIRWPLSLLEISIEYKKKKVEESINLLEKILKKQVNVKKIKFSKLKEGKTFRYGKLSLNTQLTPELFSEGFTREVIRRIQFLRKKSGLEKIDKISLVVAGQNISSILDKEKIAELVNASELKIIDLDELKQDVGSFLNKNKNGIKEKFKIKEKEVAVCFSKVR